MDRRLMNSDNCNQELITVGQIVKVYGDPPDTQN